MLGSGKQWVPWITIGDVVGALHHALMSDDVSGPMNVVGPDPVTNHTFTKALGRVLWRMERLSEASAPLQSVIDGSKEPALQYLAHLFQGRVKEDSGDVAADGGLLGDDDFHGVTTLS